jgi:hypothetical protein
MPVCGFSDPMTLPRPFTVVGDIRQNFFSGKAAGCIAANHSTTRLLISFAFHPV